MCPHGLTWRLHITIVHTALLMLQGYQLAKSLFSCFVVLNIYLRQRYQEYNTAKHWNKTNEILDHCSFKTGRLLTGTGSNNKTVTKIYNIKIVYKVKNYSVICIKHRLKCHV